MLANSLKMNIENKFRVVTKEESEVYKKRYGKLKKIFYAIIVLIAIALIVFIYYILKKYYQVL